MVNACEYFLFAKGNKEDLERFCEAFNSDNENSLYNVCPEIKIFSDSAKIHSFCRYYCIFKEKCINLDKLCKNLNISCEIHSRVINDFDGNNFHEHITISKDGNVDIKR